MKKLIMMTIIAISTTVMAQDVVVRTETKNDVDKALKGSVTEVAKEAREEKLSKNAVIFRKNGIPSKLLLKSTTGAITDLQIHALIVEADETADNDVFRDLFEGYTWIDPKTTKSYTTVITRKDNWIRGDQHIEVGNSKAAYAHSTIFQRLWPATSGTGLMTGAIFRNKKSEIACDLVQEDEMVTAKTLCIQDGAKMSVSDMLGAWAKVNHPNKVRIYFQQKDITINTFKVLYQKLLAMKDLSISLVDSSNKELFRVSGEDLKLHFVRLNDRNGKPWASLDTLPDTDPNLFNVQVWFDTTKFTLPCLCDNPDICSLSSK